MSDLISRQAAIEALGEEPMVWVDSDYEVAQRNQWQLDKLAIETVPSVKPKRQTGKWIPLSGGGYKCSCCGGHALDEIDGMFVHVASRTAFCPHCGADMRKNWDI